MMRDGATIAIVVSITISVSMIGVACYFVSSIYSDINDFYEDSMKEFQSFQVILIFFVLKIQIQSLTDDAWSEVLIVNEPRTAAQVLERVFGGRKRRDLPVQCSKPPSESL